jgi:rhodanese-related sulfurtransferase
VRAQVTARERYGSVEELLADARSALDRLGPAQAAAAVRDGALLVDIRPAAQRAAERNHLEWRLHPGSDARVAAAADGQFWVVVCSEGYTSSLAAYALNSIGVPATDVVGGFLAWAASGLPTCAGTTSAGRFVS